MKTVILMGIKHCGKSTQGKLISQKLELDFYDTDDVVTHMTGKTPREIYTEKGQSGFIEAEKEACLFIRDKVSSGSDFSKPVVIATGGGICSNKEAVEILKSFGIAVYLEVSEKIAASRVLREIRVGEDGSLSNMPAYIAKKNPRSIAECGDIFHDFFVEREKIYKNIADLSINVSDSSKSENADRIIRLVKSMGE